MNPEHKGVEEETREEGKNGGLDDYGIDSGATYQL